MMSKQEPLYIDGADLPGFHNVLGYRQASWDAHESVIELELQPKHLNMGGVIHGGVLSSLLDIALAQAGTHCPYPGRVRKAVTLSLTTTFTGQCSGGLFELPAASGLVVHVFSTAPARFMTTKGICWRLVKARFRSALVVKNRKASVFKACLDLSATRVG